MRHGIGKFLCLPASVAVLALSAPVLAVGQSHASKTEDLVKRSDVIVVGKVGKRTSEWTENKRMIVTRIEITVDEVIKGQSQGSTITVVVPGGEVDGVGEWYSHTPRFAEEEELVLFAEQAGAGRLRVTGGEEGKIAVMKDEVTGQRTIPNLGTLEQLTAEIREVVNAQEHEQLKMPR